MNCTITSVDGWQRACLQNIFANNAANVKFNIGVAL